MMKQRGLEQQPSGNCLIKVSSQWISSKKSAKAHNKTVGGNNRAKTESRVPSQGRATGTGNRKKDKFGSCNKFTQLLTRHATHAVFVNHFLFTIRFAFFMRNTGTG